MHVVSPQAIETYLEAEKDPEKSGIQAGHEDCPAPLSHKQAATIQVLCLAIDGYRSTALPLEIFLGRSQIPSLLVSLQPSLGSS
jgi:hypothetical protein